MCLCKWTNRISLHVYVCRCPYIHALILHPMCVCVCVCVCVYIYVCVYVCVCIYIYICVCVCVCVCYWHTHTHREEREEREREMSAPWKCFDLTSQLRSTLTRSSSVYCEGWLLSSEGLLQAVSLTCHVTSIRLESLDSTELCHDARLGYCFHDNWSMFLDTRSLAITWKLKENVFNSVCVCVWGGGGV